MDMEKLVKLGKEMDLSGNELREFVRGEQEMIRVERKEKEISERDARAQQLELKRQELEVAEIQLELERVKKEHGKSQDDPSTFKWSKPNARIPKLPHFEDNRDELDSYLQRFERYATAQGWNQDNWAVNLSALLSGKALEVYSRLPLTEASDYKCLKSALLKRYQLTEDGFRKKFRAARPEKYESPKQFVVRLNNYFCRWTDLAKIEKDFSGLKDLLVREQFINGSNADLALFLKERHPLTMDNMADLAEKYVEARGGVFGQDRQIFSSFQRTDKVREHPQRSNTNVVNKPIGHDRPLDRKPHYFGSERTGPRQLSFDQRQSRICYKCHKPGHLARNCWSSGSPMKVAGLIEHDDESTSFQQSLNQSQQHSASPNQTQQCSECHQAVITHCSTPPPDAERIACMYIVEKAPLAKCCSDKGLVILQCGHHLPLMSAACRTEDVKGMPVTKGKLGTNVVSVLRDTGCTGVVIRRSLVSQNQLTGTNKYCVLVDGTIRKVPVAHVTIDSPYFIGSVEALCMVNPVYDVIIGNIPTARNPGNPDLMWTSSNCITQNSESSSDSKQPTGHHHDHVSAVQTRAQKTAAEKPLPALKVPSALPEVTADELREAQQHDPTLHHIRELTNSGEVKIGRGENSSHFFLEKGLIYRQFCSPKVDSGDVITQLVVPKRHRVLVMKLAHEAILGGHQGSRKTADKVLSNFFWPGVQSDVQRYCRSCDICQRTIPKGKVTKVPLDYMPLIDEPFQRIAVDIVGPISPVTERGNRYILTMVDYATRYPEAVPLKSIEAHRVAEALVDVFTRVGIPREILTDQGAQFTSGVMKEVSRLLCMRQLTTTPYHPSCNGLVERFNGSLKQMLKRLCAEKPKDWDRYIGPLLFAYRETPQSSLGFAPFDILYGRTVRGPMTILKELWSDEVKTPEVKTTYEYVLDLRSRIEATCQLAQEELKKSTARYKKYYDRKARPRHLKEGDKVLLLLPADHNKLLLHWKGPFTVLKKIGNYDYKIDLGTREKTFHINLLKHYIERPQVTNAVESCFFSQVSSTGSILDIVSTAVIEAEPDGHLSTEMMITEEDQLRLPNLMSKESINDVQVYSGLSTKQKNEVRSLLLKYSAVLTDLPGRTSLTKHDIKLTSLDPIRSKPYPLPHALRDTVKEEVKSMLEMGVIERAESPYASPIVLIKKKDGTQRFCIDFRRLNRVTIFDAEPMPDPEEIFAKLSLDIFFTKIDLSKGYWQIPLHETAKEKTAFLTPDGLYQFRTMPFGLINAPATFSRMMRVMLRDLQHVDNFIDDILVHTKTWEEHLNVLDVIFQRLGQSGVTARPSKCYVGFDKLEYLGHIVGHGQLKPLPDKLTTIQNALRPKTKKQLRSFLGLTGYYRRFIPNYAAIAVPLTDKTKKREPNHVVWETSQEFAFKTLKARLTSAPVLRLPDCQQDFLLQTDSTGVGAVLLQKHGGTNFPVAYASRKLLQREQAYSTIERECLAIVWAVQKFQTYLYGRNFVLETDHQPLTYLQQAKVANGRILRWALILQPYRFRIESIKGSENVGADYLSRVST